MLNIKSKLGQELEPANIAAIDPFRLLQMAKRGMVGQYHKTCAYKEMSPTS
jgi:hypothetical protein